METLIAVLLLVLAAIGGLATIFATPDFYIIKMCETRGYWQSGQVRIVCQVEKPVAPPKPSLSLIKGRG